MSKGHAPAPPDPVALANAQTSSNADTARLQAQLDRVNQVTPYGTTTYTNANPNAPDYNSWLAQQTSAYQNDPNNQAFFGQLNAQQREQNLSEQQSKLKQQYASLYGSPDNYVQTTTLSPLGQQLLDLEQNLAKTQLQGEQQTFQTLLPLGQQLAGQVQQANATPLDFTLNSANTPFWATLSKGPQLLNQDVVNAIYGQQKGFLDPQWDQQQQQLEDQLSRQGVMVGSDAYNNAMKQLFNSRTQAYQSAQDASIAGGTNAASQLFNMALSGQQQDISQQQQQFQNEQLERQLPMSLLSQLLGTTQGTTPQTPSQPIAQAPQVSVQPTDVIGATLGSYNDAMQGYQAQLQQQNATMGGIGSLASIAAIGAIAI